MSKAKWNPMMYDGAKNIYNVRAGENGEWNIAHVINALGSHGIPADRLDEARELVMALASDQINTNIEVTQLREAMRAVRRTHAEVGMALRDDNILRVEALIQTWERDHGQ